jgi:hypothetical protein
MTPMQQFVRNMFVTFYLIVITLVWSFALDFDLIKVIYALSLVFLLTTIITLGNKITDTKKEDTRIRSRVFMTIAGSSLFIYYNFIVTGLLIDESGIEAEPFVSNLTFIVVFIFLTLLSYAGTKK